MNDVQLASRTQAFVFLREFVLGNNQTGLVTNSSGAISVIGGENSTLAGTVLPGQLGIYVGTGTTQSTFTYPSATIAAWNSFIATVTSQSAAATSSSTGTGTDGGQQTSAGLWNQLRWW
jgi:carboxypeptidase D